MRRLDNVAGLWYDNRVTVSNAQGVFFANKPNIIHNQNKPAFGPSPADTVTSTANLAKAGYFINAENRATLTGLDAVSGKVLAMKTLSLFILRNFPPQVKFDTGGAR